MGTITNKALEKVEEKIMQSLIVKKLEAEIVSLKTEIEKIKK